MRLAIAILASCACALPTAAQAGTAPLAEALLSTAFASAAGVVPSVYDLRARVSTVTAWGDRLHEGDSSLRMRLGASMVDFYPIRGQGFHVSVGLRLFVRHNFVREAERASGQRLLPPRGSTGFGSGARRYTPAAMFGYNLLLGPDVSFGLEGGAVAGRLNAVAPGLDGRHGLDGVRMYPRASINPVVRTSLAMRF